MTLGLNFPQLRLNFLLQHHTVLAEFVIGNEVLLNECHMLVGPAVRQLSSVIAQRRIGAEPHLVPESHRFVGRGSRLLDGWIVLESNRLEPFHGPCVDIRLLGDRGRSLRRIVEECDLLNLVVAMRLHFIRRG